jgi:hypothetical protein
MVLVQKQWLMQGNSPTIRPANQRYPQPPFVFPITPPSTAGLDALVSRNEPDETQRDSLWTPTRSPSTPAVHPRDTYFCQASPRPPRHKRAHSYSTLDEQYASIRDSDAGAFKVVIERGPKKPDYLTTIPTLEVPIPSYKLGTPRFSMRGTAFLRNSSYTGTDDVRSSIFSHKDPSQRDMNSRRATRILSRRHSDASPQPHHTAMPPSSPYDLASMAAMKVARQRSAIVPEMFDALTFKPACDHPAVVRYSMGGGIRAATPARLVAEITSPTFVDYDLLSDFFLTFRSFMDTTDLLYMLIARLKWALSREDETGTVVRVRTFVALRHWILNYFLDDYVVDYDLRKSFCDLLNNFVGDLPQDSQRTKVPLKILGELKKCWRRVCALYWDGPEFDTELGPDVPILPGGVAGSRNPRLDPSFWEKHPQGPPRLEGIIDSDVMEEAPSVIDGRNFFADVSRAGHLDSAVPPSLTTPRGETADVHHDPPLSPTSIMSEDFVSCSFPSRARAIGGGHPVGAHPVIASSVYDNGPPVATTPKALTGKRVRPTHAHKRSGSFSDSFRDYRPPQQPVQKVIYKSTELLLALPYAGSLVRGNMFPPAQAFVDVIAPSTPAEVNRATILFPGTTAPQKGPSAMSGPGMKRLLGSVRRALSTRTGPSPNASPTQGSFPHIPPLGVRGATINRLPGTAVVPQARPRNTEAKAPMRIDLLAAEVAEDFKKAVREDAEAEASNRGTTERGSSRSSEHDPGLHYLTMQPDFTLEPSRPTNRRAPVSEMTTGSKSIVIVDDTTLEPPMMTGALPMNQSVDTFADAFMQPSGDPTPPSTPPEVPLGTPRRSSHLLGQHTRNRSASFEGTPSLGADSRPSRDDELSPSHRPLGRPSMRSRGQSYKVKKSLSLRRYASYHSGFTQHRSDRSFDATTFSESDDIEQLSHQPSVPLPLRVLRRRPGGDLRAVANVGDLNVHPLRRPKSTGSMTAYSDSVRSSYLLGRDSDYVDVVNSDYDQSQPDGHTFSLGALAEASPKHPVSLFSTHSSQPVMRPSFEKEAQMLAQIPDDDDDDGGVESALLKLEGKFEQRRSEISGGSPSRSRDFLAPSHNSFGAPPYEVSTLTLDEEEEEEEKRKHRHKHIVETAITKTPPLVQIYRPQQQPPIEALKPTLYQPRGMQPGPTSVPPKLVESYNSTPLLERGLTDDGHDGRHTRNWSEHSILRGPSNERLDLDVLTPDSSHPNSFDFIDKTDSMKRIPHCHALPEEASMDQSFLDSDSDRSDLSSELSLEVISRTEYTEHDSTSTQTFPPIRAGTVMKEIALPSHPLRHPPSPPITMRQALKLSPSAPNVSPMNRSPPEQGTKPLPPTPETTPTAPLGAGGFGGDRGASPSVDPLRSHRIPEASRKTSVHLPFILAFDSQILAQQFTLIEKDALNEIDWKDLIEMRWKDRGNTESRSWVDFLRTSEPRGVEVVIARFNLMVKWAVSECVLTQDLTERVRCIIKLIHIAAQCRKHRNFATMTQLTVALTSKDLTRLTRTWAYVPAADVKTLRELEALVTPTSNFHSIRAEMEGSGADQGCIPFVGIYTHDLLVNSERPSQIASTPTTEPLINFERCRMDATIVKNLLRLLEASQLYRFLPIEGVTERCLWMAALSDEEIARYGTMIQE